MKWKLWRVLSSKVWSLNYPRATDVDILKAERDDHIPVLEGLGTISLKATIPNTGWSSLESDQCDDSTW